MKWQKRPRRSAASGRRGPQRSADRGIAEQRPTSSRPPAPARRVARALVADPELLILDEPTGPLETRDRDEFRDEIRRLHAEAELTTLVLTHHRDEALALADRLAVMDLGKIVQVGTPAEVYNRPADAFVARLLGPTNLLQGQVAAIDSRGEVVVRTTIGRIVGRLCHRRSRRAGTPVTLAIRPESSGDRPERARPTPTASPRPSSGPSSSATLRSGRPPRARRLAAHRHASPSGHQASARGRASPSPSPPNTSSCSSAATPPGRGPGSRRRDQGDRSSHRGTGPVAGVVRETRSDALGTGSRGRGPSHSIDAIQAIRHDAPGAAMTRIIRGCARSPSPCCSGRSSACCSARPWTSAPRGSPADGRPLGPDALRPLRPRLPLEQRGRDGRRRRPGHRRRRDDGPDRPRPGDGPGRSPLLSSASRPGVTRSSRRSAGSCSPRSPVTSRPIASPPGMTTAGDGWPWPLAVRLRLGLGRLVDRPGPRSRPSRLADGGPPLRGPSGLDLADLRLAAGPPDGRPRLGLRVRRAPDRARRPDRPRPPPHAGVPGRLLLRDDLPPRPPPRGDARRRRPARRPSSASSSSAGEAPTLLPDDPSPVPGTASPFPRPDRPRRPAPVGRLRRPALGLAAALPGAGPGDPRCCPGRSGEAAARAPSRRAGPLVRQTVPEARLRAPLAPPIGWAMAAGAAVVALAMAMASPLSASRRAASPPRRSGRCPAGDRRRPARPPGALGPIVACRHGRPPPRRLARWLDPYRSPWLLVTWGTAVAHLPWALASARRSRQIDAARSRTSPDPPATAVPGAAPSPRPDRPPALPPPRPRLLLFAAAGLSPAIVLTPLEFPDRSP